MLVGDLAALVTDQELQGREHGHQGDRHAPHDAALLALVAAQRLKGGRAKHRHTGREIGRGHHVGET